MRSDQPVLGVDGEIKGEQRTKGAKAIKANVRSYNHSDNANYEWQSGMNVGSGRETYEGCYKRDWGGIWNDCF